MSKIESLITDRVCAIMPVHVYGNVCNVEEIDEIAKKYGLKVIDQNYAYFPVIIEPKVFGATRNEIMEVLAEHGIMARKYFYPLTSSFECFHGKFDVDATPVARYMPNRVIILLLYADLPVEKVNEIYHIIIGLQKG